MEKHVVRFWVRGQPADNALLEALSSVLAPPGFDRMLGAAYLGLCLGRLLALGPWGPRWYWDKQTYVASLLNMGWTQQRPVKENQSCFRL